MRIFNLPKGFTLIELLVSIAIIGILATVILANVQGVRERARDFRRKSDLNGIVQALRLYYTDYKSFPTNANGAIVGCGALGTTTCSWGTQFGTTNVVYMNRLPLDPLSSTANSISYQYESPTSDQYIIVAKLENKSDNDAANSRTRCATLYANFQGTKDTGSTPNKDYVVCSE